MLEDENDPEVRDPMIERVGGEEELASEKKRSEDLLNRLKYLQADLENYRKRVDREVREAAESSTRALVVRLLVVQDELDLAVKHAEAERGSSELKEGIQTVARGLGAALESAGVTKIECLGEPFDPTLHEAVEKVQGSRPGEDVVVDELRPGFMFRGQLIRPSMVKVELALRRPKVEAEKNE